jgi:hypothetical protein
MGAFPLKSKRCILLVFAGALGAVRKVDQAHALAPHNGLQLLASEMLGNNGLLERAHFGPNESSLKLGNNLATLSAENHTKR